MGFSVQTPAQILFGRGMKDRVADAIIAFGARGVLVHGANLARSDWPARALRAKGLHAAVIFPAQSEPTLPMLEAALAIARPFAPDWVSPSAAGRCWTWARRWPR